MSRFEQCDDAFAVAGTGSGDGECYRRDKLESEMLVTRRDAVGVAFALATAGFGADTKDKSTGRVRLARLPNGGIQPQVVVEERGVLHTLYYSGDARQGDLFYTRSTDGGATFSAALQVNSHPGSAIAAGTIRGAQIALGKDGRVHVAWNGSSAAELKGPVNPDSGKPGSPMLYSRLNDAGTAFEPERNVMHRSFGLDGGGSVAWQLYDRSGQPASEKGVGAGLPVWSFAAPSVNVDGSFSILY